MFIRRSSRSKKRSKQRSKQRAPSKQRAAPPKKRTPPKKISPENDQPKKLNRKSLELEEPLYPLSMPIPNPEPTPTFERRPAMLPAFEMRPIEPSEPSLKPSLMDRFGYETNALPVLMFDVNVRAGEPKPIDMDKLISYKSEAYKDAVQEVNSVISKVAKDFMIDNTNVTRYFPDMKIVGSGGHGAIGKSKLFEALEVIVKKCATYETGGLEFYNLLVLSDLCEYIPHFPLPYMYFTCLSNTDGENMAFCIKPKVEQSDINTITEEAEFRDYGQGKYTPKLREFIIMENAGSKTFKEACSSQEECVSIVLQVMFALHIAQEHAKFTHYDLHRENVMLKKFDTSHENVWFYYKVNGTNYKVPLINHSMAMLIDLGLSHCEEGKNKPHLLRMGWTEEQLKTYQSYASMSDDSIFPDQFRPYVDHIKFLLLTEYQDTHVPSDFIPMFNTFKQQYKLNIYKIVESKYKVEHKDPSYDTPLSVIKFIVKTDIYRRMMDKHSTSRRTVYQWNEKGKRGICREQECE